MKIKITRYAPQCQSVKVKKNGKKLQGKQNYFCKECGRQLTGDHALSYKGRCSGLTHRILLTPVRGVGVRDAAAVENVRIGKVLSVGMEGNSCCRRRRIRRAFRKPCCFAKKSFNHLIARGDFSSGEVKRGWDNLYSLLRCGLE